MVRIVLLGPQRHRTTLGETVETLGLTGPFAAITAGWQEREAEVEELDEHIGQKTLNLVLHQRAEEIFQRDPSFREAHRAHQDKLKKIQTLYRMRLVHVQGSVLELMKRQNSTEAPLLDPEIEHAIEMIRLLDKHHLNRIREMNTAFQEQWSPDTNSIILDHYDELAEIVDQCSAILIAGGHVAVLLNRLRLLKLDTLIRDKTIIAWSAGAMALAGQVVLFHDSPPQGRGFAEAFETGLGLLPNIIPLPHAKKRLQLDNQNRVSIFARRFAKKRCLTLEEGSRIVWDRGRRKEAQGIYQLTHTGELASLEGA